MIYRNFLASLAASRRALRYILAFLLIIPLARRGGKLLNHGRYKEALTPTLQAYKLSKYLMVETDPFFDWVLHNLALTYIKTGDLTAAEPLLRQVLEIRRRTVGETHPAYARSLYTLACWYMETGDSATAAPLLHQALKLQCEALRASHPDVARSLAKVAELHMKTGNYTAAEPLLRQALEIAQTTLGKTHPDTIVAMGNLATLYLETDHFAAAEPLLHQTRELLRTTPWKTHPEVAKGLIILEGLDVMKNNNTATAPILYRAVKTARKVEGYLQKGDYTSAECVMRQLLESHRVVLGETHPQVAWSLSTLVAITMARGDYAAAESVMRQLLESHRAALGETHPEVARCLAGLGRIKMEQGDYATAESVMHEALAMSRIALGETHPEVARCLNNLAHLYIVKGDYATAEPLLHSAFDILRTAQGETQAECATTLTNIAVLAMKLGNYARAKPLLHQALEMHRTASGETHIEFTITLHALAMLYIEQGDYTAAEPLLHQALQIRRTTLGARHPYIAIALYGLAALSMKKKDYAAAELLFHQALEIFRSTLGEAHSHTADCLHNLAALYTEQGVYATAEAMLHRALDATRLALGKQHPDIIVSLTSLANLYIRKGEYAAAAPLLRQAFDAARIAWGETHPAMANILLPLAELYGVMGDDLEAERLRRQALMVARMASGVDGVTEETVTPESSLDQALELIARPRDTATVEALLHEEPEWLRGASGEAHLTPISLTHQAALHIEKGQYMAAEPLLREALEIHRRTGSDRHPNMAASLLALAQLSVVTGKVSEAFSLMEQAAVIDDWIIGQVFSISSEQQRMGYLAKLQGHFHMFFSLVIQHGATSLEARQKGFDIVLRRKALGTEVMAVQQDVVLSGRYPDVEPELRQLRALQKQIVEKTFAGPGPEGSEVHQALLEGWKHQEDRKEAELAMQIPEMNLAQQLRTIDHRAIAQALPEGTTLVEFVHFRVFDFKAMPARGETHWKPARYLAFVLPAGEPDSVEMVDLGEAELIDERITKFRKAIARQNTRRNERDMGASPSEELVSSSSLSEGSALRELLAPLWKTLNGRKRLLLAPDGELALFPFEVLPIGDGHYLIDDDYHISYLGVGRDVLRFGAPSTAQPADALVIADPDFDLASNVRDASPMGPDPVVKKLHHPARVASQRTYGRRSFDRAHGFPFFKRLPGTRVEGERIAAMLGVRPWLEGTAVESRLKSCSSPRILHLATHGFFLKNQKHDPDTKRHDLGAIGGQIEDGLSWLSGLELENPLLRSGLVFAGVNTWRLGGRLHPEAEDGILTAEDASGLDLRATDLVVLSACETGLGEVHVGEGVYGLRRAFMLAGAKTLVMSLWRVEDQQAQELMVDFYRRVLAGQSRADALREAQLTLKTNYPHPADWGAFICQGDPGPLPQHGVSDCVKMLENRRCENAGDERGGQKEGSGRAQAIPAPSWWRES